MLQFSPPAHYIFLCFSQAPLILCALVAMFQMHPINLACVALEIEPLWSLAKWCSLQWFIEGNFLIYGRRGLIGRCCFCKTLKGFLGGSVDSWCSPLQQRWTLMNVQQEGEGGGEQGGGGRGGRGGGWHGKLVQSPAPKVDADECSTVSSSVSSLLSPEDSEGAIPSLKELSL